MVAFESPRRIRASLGAIAARWPDRRVAVCRELTKLHEEVVRGTASEVLERLSDPVRGEIVLVIEASSDSERGSGAARPRAAAVSRETARRALGELLGSGIGTKQAAGIVAELTGLSRRTAYELALEVRTGGSNRP